MAAEESGEVGAAKSLRLEQKSDSLLPELVFLLSQPGDLGVYLLTAAFLKAVACLIVLLRGMFFFVRGGFAVFLGGERGRHAKV